MKRSRRLRSFRVSDRLSPSTAEVRFEFGSGCGRSIGCWSAESNISVRSTFLKPLRRPPVRCTLYQIGSLHTDAGTLHIPATPTLSMPIGPASFGSNAYSPLMALMFYSIDGFSKVDDPNHCILVCRRFETNDSREKGCSRICIRGPTLDVVSSPSMKLESPLVTDPDLRCHWDTGYVDVINCMVGNGC